jgi:hypothetical protein
MKHTRIVEYKNLIKLLTENNTIDINNGFDISNLISEKNNNRNYSIIELERNIDFTGKFFIIFKLTTPDKINYFIKYQALVYHENLIWDDTFYYLEDYYLEDY